MSETVMDYFGVGLTSTAFFGLLCIFPFVYSAIYTATILHNQRLEWAKDQNTNIIAQEIEHCSH